MFLSAGLGGLRYPMVSIGGQEIVSLHEFCDQPDVGEERVQAVLERLLRIMDNVWGFHRAVPDFDMRGSYDAVLPPHLLLHAVAFPADAVVTPITPDRLPSPLPKIGDAVVLLGFAVHKIDPLHRTLTLRAPIGAPAFAVRARIPDGEPLPDYQAHQIVEVIAGEVIETRMSRLCGEVAALGMGIDPAAPHVPLAANIRLPNPLDALPHLLDQKRGANIATIHGDFNLENILVDPQLGDISLIDFAEARQDHVLHDLLHLEAEVIVHILPGIIARHKLDPAHVLATLGWQLHRAMGGPANDPGMPEHPALCKPWVLLRAIRLAARRYLFDTEDAGEYYHGLALYLLGTLRFKNLGARPEHPLPKQLAFWGAALACQWLAHPNTRTPPDALVPLLETARSLWSASAGRTPRPGPASADVAELLAALPTDKLPPGGALPAGSRMPLERNPRFVGRQPELLRLAATLKRGHISSPEIGDGPKVEDHLHVLRQPTQAGRAIAVAGLGGVGKTQLACEFVHRCGRFFAGGVFWITCADPAAVPAEIAACGDRGGLHVRPNFGELPLEQQVQLVLDEWRKPIPRLLVFDNCETPELLERFFPREGGARALLTSRRAGWQTELGIATLDLEVLPRAASLALLRAHQPDADADLLDAIAQELGDLPLALHLAGSYLARYRYETDAAGYLDSLRISSPLGHLSLQGRTLLPTEHDGNVARTFALSYDQLDQDDPIAKLALGLLQGAACLAPSQPIPEALVRLALDADGEDAAKAARAGFEMGSAIDQLVELGLMRAEADHALWLHRLVAVFTRDRAGTSLERVRARVERALGAEAERLNKQRDPAPLRGWQVHLRHVADDALRRGDEMAADLGHALAEHLYQTGDYAAARAYHELVLNIRRTLLGSNHPAIARSLTQIGKALLFYGDAIHAQPYFEQALEIQQQTLGDHADTATTLNHLGFLLMRHEQLDAAQPYHEQALRIRRRILGDHHPAVADSFSNLAYIEYARGHLNAAQALLQQALFVQRKATGDEHPDTARLLIHLGELLTAQSKFEEAESVFNQAMVILERELGDNHPETARTLSGLGNVRRLVGDIAGAKSYYKRALDVFMNYHGAEHFRTRQVLAQLSALHRAV
jgi:tetratricopeptide (TPR) repeat protein